MAARLLRTIRYRRRRHSRRPLAGEFRFGFITFDGAGPGAEGATLPGTSQAPEPSERGTSGEQAEPARRQRLTDGESTRALAGPGVNLSGPWTEGETDRLRSAVPARAIREMDMTDVFAK